MQALAIFALSLLLFIGYSKVPDYMADAIHLKQIGQDAEEETEEAEALAAEDESDNIKEPVDTTSQRILIIGDSMSQLLALRFSDYANQNGHKLLCVTWNGSGTRQWANCDTLNHYIHSFRPTHVFISLGSNELYTADLKNCRKRAEQIIAKAGSVPVTWVGPPNWTEDKGINTMLQRLVGKRHFFMTKGIKLERQKDGRHPTRAAAVVWVDKIVEWMKTGKAAHPFRLDKPKKRSTNYKQIVIPMNPGKRHAEADSVSPDNEQEIIDGQPPVAATDPQSPATHDIAPHNASTHDAAPAPAANSHTPADGGKAPATAPQPE